MSDNRLRLFGHLSAGSESIDGKISIKALRGYSAYEIAVQEGFTGTEEEWLASMVGPQGPQGPEGPQGPQGIQGARGIQGESGKPISSIEKTGTDGYVDTYTITYNDSSSSTFTVTNGKNAEVEVWEDSTPTDYRLVFTDDKGSVTTPNLIPQADIVSQKADKDGSYDDLTSGTSKQLLSESYTLDQIPYLFRKSPDSDRAVEEIVGGTVGWNQLINPSKFVTNYGITASLNGEVISFSGTSTAGFTGALGRYALPTNHICLLLYRIIANPNNISFKCDFNNNITGKKTTSTSCIATVSSSDVNIGLAGYTSGTVFDGVQIKAIVSDLTACFGTTIADYICSLETATAGAGVSKLKEWGLFTEDYYDYCEPTLRSVEGLVSKKTVGFNQVIPTPPIFGGYNRSVGDTLNTDPPNATVSGDNPIYIDVPEGWKGATFITEPVLSGHVYRVTANLIGDVRASIYLVDSNYTVVYRHANFAAAVNVSTNITIPSGGLRVAFFIGAGSAGRVVVEDFCINLSDPTKNGQYEPYESHTYPLDSSVVLRGVPKLDSNNNLYFDGDIYPADGQGKRRYGLVDLGSLEWAYITDDSYAESPLFASGNIPYKKAGSNNIVCGIYVTANSRKSIVNKVIAPWNNTNALSLAVRDDSYTDAATFKASLSGIYLLYELATPTTFTAQPYHNPQIVGDTEEWVTTGIVPVGHNTRYYQNLRKKIEGLPWNFSSLIAPTEVTFVATRNYYKNDLFIVNNILYKASANIANNGTITPDTNCRATTLAEVIANL